MLRNKLLAIPSKFQCLTIILANQIAQSGFGEPDASSELGAESPFELLGVGVHVLNDVGFGLGGG